MSVNKRNKMESDNVNLQVIEFEMMDKRKYYPLTLVSTFSIRSLLYPFTLIKTRLQIQRGSEIYKGTFDAFFKISKNEGASGLYRGFWVNCLQLIPTVSYISCYEATRQFLKENTEFTHSKTRSFLAGGMASVVGQTLGVPIDIVSQHMMLLGQRAAKERRKVDGKLAKLQTLQISESARTSRLGSVQEIMQQLYVRDGLRGFYKGYFVSILVFAPNSALWWAFYDTYTVFFAGVAPPWVPRLAIQCFAGTLSGLSASTITNPLDVIRARIQVEGSNMKETMQVLWEEEGYRMAFKGLSARLIQSVLFSFFIILGYESIKRLSLLEEYRKDVRW